MTAQPAPLPEGITVLERGWLSANNVLLHGHGDGAWLVDSGYCTHAEQTLTLVDAALQGERLAGLLNTHLHSDHCGGNAALQARHPGLPTWIPPGHAAAVTAWDESALTYAATGQSCPRFAVTGVLEPGTEPTLGRYRWQIHAAPGHDPHAVLLFQPDQRVLISGDALWQNGFGVVFPELEGDDAYGEVGATLDLIEQLAPRVVIPGHGAAFGGGAEVARALARARTRLAQFTSDPQRHTRYGLKVLLKFKLMEWQTIARGDFIAWAQRTRYLVDLHRRHGQAHDFVAWLDDVVQELAAAGALTQDTDGSLRDA